jgi:hypothetical protein
MKEPGSVNEVYVLANTRVTMKKGSGYTVGASYTTIEEGMSRKQGKCKGKGKNHQKGNKANKKLAKDRDDGEEKNTKKSEEDKKKTERNLDNVECFNCGNKGHFARDCPENEDKEDEEPMVGMTMKDDGDCFQTGLGNRNFYMYEILLDSGSQEVNCVHPRFLSELRGGTGGFRGLSGKRMTVNKIGKLAGFFDCL